VDITDAEFETKVIEASKTKPVAVDFWATWCGPCRALAPVLDKVVKELGNKIELVKVNIDENPEAAGRYMVRSIPAVKIFKDGNLVGEFIGALPAGDVKKHFEEAIG
jgi:thioredoxin